ncbi:PA2169 family four-helix-bundle protein [Roseiconus nitratireducens]|uniref:PA2169 family four-helix-bundle protein n=1 Tax=Roseiconus nitratireducens TaxID=2605748 RepID=UPI001F361AD7|nr:PA2169 family four-helix-bundle protein [Roseiconus nitratireducens]
MNEETVDKLQKLIRANIDSYDGFKESAEEVSDGSLKALFKQAAEERSAMATELQNYVQLNGKEAEDEGSVAAKTHRVWMNIRSKLSGGSPHQVLVEAERGEDHIKAAYEEVLKETAGSAMNDVLQAQYRKVKEIHDKIRDLRDASA